VRGVALPVALRAGKGGRTLTALWQAEVRCKGSGGHAHRDNFTPTTRIAADGTFVRRERYTRRSGTGGTPPGTGWWPGRERPPRRRATARRPSRHPECLPPH
jgi:hypothetical protein